MNNLMITLCFLNVIMQALCVNNSEDKTGRVTAMLGWFVAMLAYIQLKG